ncbi:MAG: nodulation protein NfeD [candidate division Zixibacteria bacterium]|jgi:membrane-bound serine protease (ClpP class)|nr:nodulation protein NfeD [candidate division Zixibacteria bacterium]
MKHKILLFLIGFLLLSPGFTYTLRLVADDSVTADSVPLTSQKADKAPAIVYVMQVDGAIGIVTEERIEEAIAMATESGAELIVIEMDTPGGFMDATQGITKMLLNSEVPVCTYVAPSGSRAGSAGVYIAYASHFAAMAPSTNIGAAHPVGGQGQQIDSVMNEKVTNDAVAQIRAAAERRGRNVEWAEKAVRESVSITDREALEMNVIDVRAKSLNDLLNQLNGRTTKMADDSEKVMRLDDYVVRTIEMSFKDQLLSILSSPTVAFALLSIGGLGVILELYNPGAILPGVVGGISLLLGAYSLNLLPINYAGVLLIFLAIIMFVAEFKIASAGLLTIGGIIALFFGGLLLVDSVDPAMQVSRTALITIVVLVGLSFAIITRLVVRAQRSRPFTGDSALVGRTATVRKPGFVYIEGALWRIAPADGFDTGDKVEITAVDGLTLRVKKVDS